MVDDHAKREVLLDPAAGRGTEPPCFRRVLEKFHKSGCPGLVGALADQPAGLPIGDQVGVSADARDDAGERRGHRFQERVAHSLGHAGQREDIRRSEVIGGIGHRADELHPVGDAEPARPCALSRLPVFTGADQDQVGRGLAGNLAQASSSSGRFF